MALPFWHVLHMFRTLLMRGYFFAKLLNSTLASSNGCETWWLGSWCHYEAIEYLTCSFGHVYNPMLNFVYLRNSCIFGLIHALPTRGKFEHDLGCCMQLEGFQVVSSYFWARVVSQVASAWPVRYTGLTGVVPKCRAILSTGLTGEVDRSDR
jgi:hypothetical protein